MLTDEDIKKLIEVFATREEIKEMIAKLVTKEEFSNLQSSVNAYAKKADTYFQEMVMLAHKVDRHGRWIKQIADKLGIKLEYRELFSYFRQPESFSRVFDLWAIEL